MSDASPQVLFVVPDCPGYFTECALRLAERLLAAGHRPAFAVSTPYYERFKGVDLSAVGPVHYVSDFLERCPDAAAEDVAFDYWLAHATFMRTRYYWGRHINTWNDYRKVVLFFRDLFARYPTLRLVWSEIPSNSTNCIAYAEARRHGVRYFGYASARVPDHFTVATDLYASELLENRTPPTLDGGGSPDYMKHAAQRSVIAPVERALGKAPRKIARALTARVQRSVEVGQTASHQVRALKREVGRRLYFATRIPRAWFSDPPSGSRDEISIVFPLHYRPEASTSVQAQFYESDQEVIRNLAFSLPHRATLYVKEHPAAIGIRPRAFYQDVLSYPGVRLLSPEPAMPEILGRFDALVALTTTAGFEAVQLGVPVLLLGRTFYETYPGVTRIDSFRQLRQAVAGVQRGTPRHPNPEPLRLYARHCFPGSFSYLWEGVVSSRNAECLAAPLLHELAKPAHVAHVRHVEDQSDGIVRPLKRDLD